MSTWQVLITRTETCLITVDARDVWSWRPDLKALAGTDDEVLVGAWADTLQPSWEREEVYTDVTRSLAPAYLQAEWTCIVNADVLENEAE